MQYPSQEIDSEVTQYADIHAGGFETSLMLGYYPEYVDIDLAGTLKPTDIRFQDLGEAFGNPQKYLPLGYVGSPADYKKYNGKEYLEEACRRMAKAIAEYHKDN